MTGLFVTSAFVTLLPGLLYIIINYFLRNAFDNRFPGIKSDYLFSTPLTQMAIAQGFALIVEKTFDFHLTRSMDSYYSELQSSDPPLLLIILVLLSFISCIVVTIISTRNIYHVFNHKGDANLLKIPSYVGVGLNVLCAIIAIFTFGDIESIIFFIIFACCSVFLEYKYLQSIQLLYQNGVQESFHEQVLRHLSKIEKMGVSSTAIESENKKVVVMKYCPECGEKIDSTSEVCPICGEKTGFNHVTKK